MGRDLTLPGEDGENSSCVNSVWVFVLLAIEAMKTYKANPYFRFARPIPFPLCLDNQCP